MKRNPTPKAQIHAAKFSRLFPSGTDVDLKVSGFAPIPSKIKGRAFPRRGDVCVRLVDLPGVYPASDVKPV